VRQVGKRWSNHHPIPPTPATAIERVLFLIRPGARNNARVDACAAQRRQDLTRGGGIDSTIYGIWYHLGIVQYLRGDFAEAAASFARAQPIAPDAGELAGSTDWLWMSLSRAGRGAEAKAMLDRRPDSKPVTNAYTRRLQLYRGEIGPDAVVTPADTDDVQVATLAYGLGNWYLVRGDKAQARRWFERSVQSGGWPGFGFIVSEVELRRLR
jgi:tetratricopeptide (TPR) repeat protein